jgi:hypothetical protein
MVLFRGCRTAASPDRRSGHEKREADGFGLSRKDAFDQTAPLACDPATPRVLRNDESPAARLMGG